MPFKVKLYIAVIILGAGLIIAASFGSVGAPERTFLACTAAALAGAALKLRLPGLAGTYALTYLPIMYSCMHLSIGQTVLIAAIGGLAQSYVNARQRPTILQAVFNAANLVVSVWVSHVSIAGLASVGINPVAPSAVALFLACYFAVNTTVVSGVLALLEGRKMGDVCSAWYTWSLPYYLIGASLIATLFPSQGKPMWEGMLITIALLALVQFYAAARDVSKQTHSPASRQGSLPLAARAFATISCMAALAFLVFGALTASPTDPGIFAIYVMATVLVSTWKVRLPDFQGTLSLNFVLLLVGAIHLNLLEVSTLAIIAAVTQSFWRPARRPKGIQVIFSAAALVVSTCLAHSGVRVLIGLPHDSFVMAAIILATIILYLANTWLVTTMIELVQGRPGGTVWLRCQFWTYAFYMVGASAAALISISAKMAGLLPSLLLLPVMYLVWLSYRAQIASLPPTYRKA